MQSALPLASAARSVAVAADRAPRGLQREIDRRVLLALGVHALVLGLALLSSSWVAVPLIGAAMVWASNTVSHIHLHTPLFVSRPANHVLSGYLTVALGVPQTLWRARHLRHHARHAARVPAVSGARVACEVAAIGLVMVGLFAAGVFWPWLAGTAIGYCLCALQGRMEHVAGVREGWSSYGRWHNRLWFNDGHHAEHHRYPGVHWSQLPARRLAAAHTSSRAPFGRVFELRPLLLGWLERVVLRVGFVRTRVLCAHLRATAKVLQGTEVRHALVVGGGLYPRTALVLRALRPDARIEILDAEAAHLEVARRFLRGTAGASITLSAGFWSAQMPMPGVDLVSLPLALRGERMAPAGESARLVHAWIWERSPGVRSAVVAWWLLKKVVLVPAVGSSAC